MKMVEITKEINNLRLLANLNEAIIFAKDFDSCNYYQNNIAYITRFNRLRAIVNNVEEELQKLDYRKIEMMRK